MLKNFNFKTAELNFEKYIVDLGLPLIAFDLRPHSTYVYIDCGRHL